MKNGHPTACYNMAILLLQLSAYSDHHIANHQKKMSISRVKCIKDLLNEAIDLGFQPRDQAIITLEKISESKKLIKTLCL